MITGDFMSIFSSAYTIFHEPRFSYHCTCIIDFGQPFMLKGGPFKFFNFLTTNGHFLQTIKDVWEAVEIKGCKIFVLSQKLKVHKSDLRKLNRAEYSNIHGRLEEVKKALYVLQLCNLSNPKLVNLQAEKCQGSN